MPYTVTQIGSVSLELGQLVRQGREFCEVLVELPVMGVEGALGTSTQPAGAHGAAAAAAGGNVNSSVSM